MRLVVEVNAKESKEICEHDGADKILKFLKDEIERIESSEGDSYKSSISIRTI